MNGETARLVTEGQSLAVVTPHAQAGDAPTCFRLAAKGSQSQEKLITT